MANDNPIQLDVTFQSTEALDVNVGEMYKGGDGTFAGLSDVSFTDLQNAQIPKYNSETGKWENAEDSGGVTELSALEDVSLNEPSDGQVLTYNGEEWVNNDLPTPTTELEDLTDVALSSLTGGQALVYDAESEKWVNGTIEVITDYRYLDELPQINGITLIGNKTAEDLHLTWEGTQEQYDAIVSKNPAVTYFITDGVPATQTHNYSTTEQVVGTWVDGSPVYEKTIYNAGGTSGLVTIPHLISNLGRVISADVVGIDNYPSSDSQFVFARISNDGRNMGITGVTNTNIIIYIDTIFSSRVVDLYITIRYTKSSS